MESAGSSWGAQLLHLLPLLLPFGFFVLVISLMVYKFVRMARRGQNPLTLQEDLALQLSRSAVLTAPRPKADRLEELKDLQVAGQISEAEHAAARVKILAE